MEEKRTIDISTATFIKIIIILLAFALLYLLKSIFALIFMAFVISSAFKPLISRLENFKIPKLLSILIVYLSFLGFLILAVVMIIQPMAIEISQFAQVFPEYYSKAQGFLSQIDVKSNSNFASDVQTSLGSIGGVLTQTVNSLLNQTIKLFGGVFSFLTIIIMAFYFSTEENIIRKFIKNLIAERHHDYIVNLNIKVQEKLGQWFRGQMILSLVIFCLSFVGLSLLGVKYALVLAIIAGVFEIIPYFGPWFSGAIAVLLTLLQSPTKALFVIILYFAIQQIESSFITPKVMGRSTGLNPLLVVISILIGFQLGGVLGGLIAVPVAAALSVFVIEFLEKKNQTQSNI